MAFSETRAAEGGGPYAAFYRWTKPQGPPPWAARFPLQCRAKENNNIFIRYLVKYT
jgi:hypothetical protein